MAQYSRKLAKGVKWWYKFDFKGKTYASECIYLSKNEAKIAEAEKLKELDEEYRNPSLEPILSLMQIINKRLDYIKIKKSLYYYNENKRYLSTLLKHFKDISIKDVNSEEIESLLLKSSEQMQKEGKDNYAVNAALRIYKALFQYTIKKHKLKKFVNPCIGIELFSVTKHLKYIPSIKEINQVKKICDEEEIMLIDFVQQTGARINEPLNVYGKHMGNNYVILYTRKKKNSDLVARKVPLKMKLPKIKDDERLFKRWTSYPKFLERKVKKLKQHPWNWHNLRHRYASLLSKKKKPIFEIMTLLGHSQLSTTQNYLQTLQ